MNVSISETYDYPAIFSGVNYEYTGFTKSREYMRKLFTHIPQTNYITPQQFEERYYTRSVVVPLDTLSEEYTK
jgi:hypothetical protein